MAGRHLGYWVFLLGTFSSMRDAGVRSQTNDFCMTTPDYIQSSPAFYDWKLVGKEELYIPYNNYRMASPNLKYADILKTDHVNQYLTRYELHRVWHVVATLMPGQRHIYVKRDMYFDEDTWQRAAVNCGESARTTPSTITSTCCRALPARPPTT